jgi:anti-anti-sigma factor
MGTVWRFRIGVYGEINSAVAMEMRVHRSDEHLTHLALTGRLDLAGVQQIEMAFTVQTAARQKPTVVDVTEVTYLSSMGVRLLLSAAKALHGRGHKLVLVKPQPVFLEVLQLGGLENVIVIEYDLEQALTAAAPAKV